ncbi:hypothetical protein ACYSNM_04515 [Myroides sp. LJL116]
MIAFKNNVLLLLCFFIYHSSNAQEKDSLSQQISVPKKIVTYTTDHFTRLRPLNIDYTFNGPYNYKYKGAHSSESPNRVNHFEHIRVSANMRFFAKNRWIIGSSIGYSNVRFDGNITNPINQENLSHIKTYHEILFSFNTLYTTTLWGKRAIFSGSLRLDTSIKNFERIKGLFSSILIIKSDQKTNFSLGVLFNIDPKVQFPVLPIIAYQNQLGRNYLLDITLPSGMHLRKTFGSSSRLSIGTDLEQVNFYLFDAFKENQTYIYRQIDINSGLKYEKAFGDLILTAKTGVKSTYKAELFEKGKKFSNPLLELKPSTRFFVTLGVSINPFTLLGKKN